MHFPTIALIGRYQDSGLDGPLRALASMLTQAGRNVLIETETARNTQVGEYPVASLEEIGKAAALAVVMGGDGTVLGVARHLAPYSAPIVGINHGHLGFITDIALPEAHTALAQMLHGNYRIEERMLLTASIWRGSQQMFAATALNDVVLNRAGRGGMIEVHVEHNDIFMYSQRADGLIIATPTGSSAYSLSAGGPLLHPGLNAMALVPVAPQTLSNRPIVIPGDGTLKLTLTGVGRDQKGANVHFDMQSWSDLQLGDCIQVQRAPWNIRFVHPQGYSYFSTLRRKLNWNLMPQNGEPDAKAG